MRLSISAADEAFLAEVREFVDRHWPAQARVPRDLGGAPRRGRGEPWRRAWFAALAARGWSVPHWPPEHGGPGWTPAQRVLFERETARAETPPLDSAGTRVVGPLLMAFGTLRQQGLHLPAIRESRCCWSLALDEEHEAALEVRPEGPAGGFVLTGTLPAVAGATAADWLLCRAAQPGRAGGSLFLVDLRDCGVTVEPLTGLDGGPGPAAVKAESVRLPEPSLLGPPGQAERCLAALPALPGALGVMGCRYRVQVERLRALAGGMGNGEGVTLAEDDDFRRKLAELEVGLAGLEALELRALGAGEGNEALAPLVELGREASAGRLAELYVEALGYHGLPFPDPLTIDNEGPIGHDYALTALADLLRGTPASLGHGSRATYQNSIARTILGF